MPTSSSRISLRGTIVSAIIASSCCWLPPILLLMGISSAGMFKAFESYRYLFTAVTFGFLGMAFYFTYRPRRAAAGVEDCCAPTGKRRFNMMAMNKVMLWGVTVMAVVFLFFPNYVSGLFADKKVVTDDMQQCMLVIEGMHCEG